MRFVRPLLLVTLLGGCLGTHRAPKHESAADSVVSAPPSTPRDTCRTCSPDVPKTPEACTQVGGRWVSVGPAKVATCSLPAADAGRPCRDHRDCESVCAAPDGTAKGARVEGRCHAWSVLAGTCLNLVEEGVALGEVCLD